MSKPNRRTDAAAASTASKPDLARETALLSVSLSRLWTRRQVDTADANIGAETDESLLYVSKDILDSPELTEISRLDGSIRTYVMAHAFPSFMRKGVYLVPRGMLLPICERLEQFASQRKDLTSKFLEAYPTKVGEARARLKDLFDAGDYPSVGEIRRLFTMTWRFYEMGVPTLLKEVKSSIWERERAKAAKEMDALRGKLEQVLRAEFLKLVEHIADRLSPDVDGRPKKFRDSVLDNLSEFFSTFEARNVVQDGALKALVKKTQGLLKGTDVGTLRDDEQYRKQMGAAFAGIKRDLDPLVEKKPVRKITLNKDATKKETAA